MKITKEMLVTEILEQDDNIAGILMKMGMHCIGCMAAGGESLEDAMHVHGFDDNEVDDTVSQLNEYLESKRISVKTNA